MREAMAEYDETIRSNPMNRLAYYHRGTLVGLTLGVIGGGILGISGVLFPFLVVAGGIVIGAWLGKILSGVLFRLSVVLFGIGGQRERAIPALVEPSILDRV